MSDPDRPQCGHWKSHKGFRIRQESDLHPTARAQRPKYTQTSLVQYSTVVKIEQFTFRVWTAIWTSSGQSVVRPEPVSNIKPRRTAPLPHDRDPHGFTEKPIQSNRRKNLPGLRKRFFRLPDWTVKQNLNSKEQQLKTAKQNLKSKEQQLQLVTTVNKSLEAALKRERETQEISINLNRRLEEANSHLKNELEADKRENERLREQISATLDFSSSYEMTCDPRGVAVIINNIRSEDMAEREGAEGDTDRLREVFEDFGFTVVTFTDLDHAKMVAAMKDQGKADHSNHDCFVCCIMSHGTMGKVFSSDDVGLDICELMKPVNAKKCPSLKGKPKLFFIQACQGEKYQGRESFDGDHDAKPVPFICNEADFFLGLATVPGYVAWRDTEDGAPYVKHMAKLLKDFGPTHDLSAIMAMVCDKMNKVDAEKCGWISSNHSTLGKNLIFKPK
ncbi:Casp10p [Branchiostoma belcheri]|nr:Casp10p [Branchiostoma belcheri]